MTILKSPIKKPKPIGKLSTERILNGKSISPIKRVRMMDEDFITEWIYGCKHEQDIVEKLYRQNSHPHRSTHLNLYKFPCTIIKGIKYINFTK